MLSFKSRPNGDLVVRAHRMFLDAPARVQQALADWILRRRSARAVIRAFVNSYRVATQPELPLFGTTPMGKRLPRRAVMLQAQGKVHDLGAMRDAVNHEYFGGK